MLDPAVCKSHETTRWTGLALWLFDGLTNPAIVIPILLGLMILPWLVRRVRRKRLISGLSGGLLVLYLVGCSPLGIVWGNQLLVSLLPPDAGEPADAIVVLGRGSSLRKERVQVASELWRNGRAPLVFASGWGDATQIGQGLANRGLPAPAIDGEPCSRTTEENAQFTAALLQPRGVQRILLVTDPPHMLRSTLTFRSLGFEVIPHPNPLPAWLDRRRQGFLVFKEYLGLIGYSLMGRFLPREAPPAEVVAQQEITNATPDWMMQH